VVAHPITLISARSGGFDFFAAFFSLLIIKNVLDHSREPSAGRLAVLWMNLCMFAEIRYETGLFLPPMVGLLLVFRLVKLDYLRSYRLIYALTPAFLLPRIWQAILRGNVPEQDPGAVTFSFTHFVENTRDYFKPIFNPFDFHPRIRRWSLHLAWSASCFGCAGSTACCWRVTGSLRISSSRP
jgi:hypothetical protein